MKNQLTILIAFLCFHYSAYSMSECNCSWEIDLVCVQINDGNIIPFPNECWANCLGFNEADFIDCNYDASFDPSCGCTLDISPVCVEATSGEVILYPNSCLAECGGYDSADFLDCNYNLPTDSACGCNYNLDEVCVEVEEGVYVPFPNPCWATCLGYSEDDYVDCETVFEDEFQAQQTLEYYYDLIMGDSVAVEEDLPSFNQQITDLDRNIINKVQIYPNPLDGNTFSMKLDVEVAANVRIDLMSVTGKLFKSLSHTAAKGPEVLRIDVGDIPSGVYYINIYSGIHSETVKFVKG